MQLPSNDRYQPPELAWTKRTTTRYRIWTVRVLMTLWLVAAAVEYANQPPESIVEFVGGITALLVIYLLLSLLSSVQITIPDATYGQPFELRLFWSNRCISRRVIWSLRLIFYPLLVFGVLSTPTGSIAGLVGALVGTCVGGAIWIAILARLLSKPVDEVAAAGTVYCTECGNAERSTHNFCQECGASLRSEEKGPDNPPDGTTS